MARDVIRFTSPSMASITDATAGQTIVADRPFDAVEVELQRIELGSTQALVALRRGTDFIGTDNIIAQRLVSISTSARRWESLTFGEQPPGEYNITVSTDPYGTAIYWYCDASNNVYPEGGAWSVQPDGNHVERVGRDYNFAILSNSVFNENVETYGNTSYDSASGVDLVSSWRNTGVKFMRPHPIDSIRILLAGHADGSQGRFRFHVREDGNQEYLTTSGYVEFTSTASRWTRIDFKKGVLRADKWYWLMMEPDPLVFPNKVTVLQGPGMGFNGPVGGGTGNRNWCFQVTGDTESTLVRRWDGAAWQWADILVYDGESWVSPYQTAKSNIIDPTP